MRLHSRNPPLRLCSTGADALAVCLHRCSWQAHPRACIRPWILQHIHASMNLLSQRVEDSPVRQCSGAGTLRPHPRPPTERAHQKHTDATGRTHNRPTPKLETPSGNNELVAAGTLDPNNVELGGSNAPKTLTAHTLLDQNTRHGRNGTAAHPKLSSRSSLSIVVGVACAIAVCWDPLAWVSERAGGKREREESSAAVGVWGLQLERNSRSRGWMSSGHPVPAQPVRPPVM